MRIFLLGKNVIDVKQIKKNVFKKVNIYFRYGLSLYKNKNNIYLLHISRLRNSGKYFLKNKIIFLMGEIENNHAFI